MSLLWGSVALLVVATVVLLLVPLVRRRRTPPPSRSEFDISVYRDQLREVDSDRERGLLADEQAEAARVEIQRRILAAGDARTTAAPMAEHKRSILVPAAVVAIFVPVGAVALYLILGTPEIPDQPLAGRPKSEQSAAADPDQSSATSTLSMEEAIAMLVRRLEKTPDDLTGWLLLGRSYMAVDRYAEAAGAFRHALDLTDGRSDAAAAYAEALIAAADGKITAESREVLDAVVASDPFNPKARYYLGLDKAQRGDIQGALNAWVDLVAVSPPGSPWLPAVRQQISRAAAELGIDPATVHPSAEARALIDARTPQLAPPSPSPSPSGADIEAAGRLSAEERDRMIRSMVDRLAARLADQPDDLDGWLRLARAYDVLGEADKAREARARADALTPR